MVAGDDPVIDLLDLFRGEPSTDCFNNVLVVGLTVKTAVYRFVINAHQQSIVVVVDDREALGFVVFEDYYPVMSKDFTVIGY